MLKMSSVLARVVQFFLIFAPVGFARSLGIYEPTQGHFTTAGIALYLLGIALALVVEVRPASWLARSNAAKS